MIIDRPNPLRARLASGPVFGAALFAWSTNVVDVAGAAGLDFIRFDTRHAWLAGTRPMTRVDSDDPLLVRKALETGAGADAARLITLGADMIELGNDISALGSAWKAARQRAGTAGPSA